MSLPHAPLPPSSACGARPPFRLRLALSLATLALLAACHKEATPPAAAPTDPNLVTIGPELAGQIKVATVGSAPISETLRVAGRLDFDEQHLARIGATVTGRITQVSAILGQNVKAGQPLAQLNSTELSDAQLAFLKANAQAQLERRNVDRAQQLYSADVIGKAELQRRENEAAIAQAERQAAADQLRVLGMSLGDVAQLGRRGTINSVTPVLSSIAGTVVERKVTQGQVVAPADALFTVADLGQLWAVADVPEQEATLVQPGQDVALEIPALGGERLHSKLIYVGDTVDPETRTVMVRTVLQNPERRLKPAMLATMLIAGKARPRLVIPAAAVVRQDNGDYVFQQLKPGQFRLIPVTLGPETAGHRVVLSGLKAGTPIVVDGAFHLNNQRQAKELEGGA